MEIPNPPSSTAPNNFCIISSFFGCLEINHADEPVIAAPKPTICWKVWLSSTVTDISATGALDGWRQPLFISPSPDIKPLFQGSHLYFTIIHRNLYWYHKYMILYDSYNNIMTPALSFPPKSHGSVTQYSILPFGQLDSTTSVNSWIFGSRHQGLKNHNLPPYVQKSLSCQKWISSYGRSLKVTFDNKITSSKH